MRFRRPRTLLLAGLLGSALLGPAAAPAGAETGGATPGGAAPGAPPVAPAIPVRLGNPVLSADGNGVTIAMRTTTVLPGRAHVHGTVARAARSVRIERLDAERGWVPVARATVRPDRSFDAYWRPGHGGVTQVRALLDRGGAGAGAATGAPQLSVALYRRGVASWYGPDGGRARTTACGVSLRDDTVGVAHRTLPCGTPVALTYRGRMVVVPVIDRGPFAPGRTWDLTAATFQALGGGEAGLIRVGALPLPGGAPTTLP